MKTIDLRRPSLHHPYPDGSRNLSKAGILLAHREAEDNLYDWMFHSTAPSSIETVLHMATAQRARPKIAPAIERLGSQRLWDMFAPPNRFGADSDWFTVALDFMGRDKLESFIRQHVMRGLDECFEHMKHEQNALAIGPEPFPQFIAWAVSDFRAEEIKGGALGALAPLEGYAIRQHDSGVIQVLRKIDVMPFTADEERARSEEVVFSS